MILYCCSIFDTAIQAFNRPFFAPAPGAALRSFVDEVNRRPEPGTQNDLFAHPDDMELYQLFKVDDQTGMVLDNTPTILIRGKDAKTTS